MSDPAYSSQALQAGHGSAFQRCQPPVLLLILRHDYAIRAKLPDHACMKGSSPSLPAQDASWLPQVLFDDAMSSGS